jgi:hypothetical protein
VCDITGRLGVNRIAFLGDSVTANQVQSFWSLMDATAVLCQLVGFQTSKRVLPAALAELIEFGVFV